MFPARRTEEGKAVPWLRNNRPVLENLSYQNRNIGRNRSHSRLPPFRKTLTDTQHRRLLPFYKTLTDTQHRRLLPFYKTLTDIQPRPAPCANFRDTIKCGESCPLFLTSSGLDPESGLVYPVIPDLIRNLGSFIPSFRTRSGIWARLSRHPIFAER